VRIIRVVLLRLREAARGQVGGEDAAGQADANGGAERGELPGSLLEMR
jgi:hypothetical protein